MVLVYSITPKCKVTSVIWGNRNNELLHSENSIEGKGVFIGNESKEPFETSRSSNTIEVIDGNLVLASFGLVSFFGLPLSPTGVPALQIPSKCLNQSPFIIFSNTQVLSFCFPQNEPTSSSSEVPSTFPKENHLIKCVLLQLNDYRVGLENFYRIPTYVSSFKLSSYLLISMNSHRCGSPLLLFILFSSQVSFLLLSSRCPSNT